MGIIALAGKEKEEEEERKVKLQIHTAPQPLLSTILGSQVWGNERLTADYCGSQVNAKNANQFSAVQKMWLKKIKEYQTSFYQILSI